MAALLAHELAHSLLARRYGVPVTSITLWGPRRGVRTRQRAAGQPASTTLGQIMTPVPPAYLAAPGDPAAPLLNRPPLTEDLAAIVLARGRSPASSRPRLRQIVRREALPAPAPVTSTVGQNLPVQGGAMREVADEPVPGQRGGGLEGARFLEQVGGTGHHSEVVLAA